MVDTKKFDNSVTATTKRQFPTTIASLFHPLGYLTPTTVKMRLFLRNLWIHEKEWDDQLENEDIETWQKVMAEMKELSSSVPKHIGGENPQLICFCDTSQKASATAIYLETLYEGKADVNLLFSKSRIAPKQKMSIPRLELLALLIGTRSLKFVSKELKLENIKITAWTDSQCALNWIKTKKSLSVFVRNILTEISSEKNLEFRYIHTKENPADLPSRGLSNSDLKENSLWWKGPEWLKQDQISWPTWNMPKIDKKTLERIQSEVRGSKTLYEASAIAQEKHVLSQRIKNTLLIISYCSRKASLSKECKPSS